MQCQCGGWVRADLVEFAGKKVVGLVCNGPCGYAEPVPDGKKTKEAVIDRLDVGRVAMGRVW